MDSERQRRLAHRAFDPQLTDNKLVLIAGPRQAGKTTLARRWLANHGCEALYFNWDDPAVRRAYRSDPHFFEAATRAAQVTQPWVAIDEVHKVSRWRDILKAWYDIFGHEFRFLITGSARLDLFRHGGDSLVGRYFLFHLYPLSFNEFLGATGPVERPSWLYGDGSLELPTHTAADGTLQQFLRRGPFPEPLLRDNDRFSLRWVSEYLQLLVRQDLRDLTRVSQLDKIEELVGLLPQATGAPISYSSLGRDMEVAHTTIRLWLEALRRLYLLIRIRPYSHRIRRALRRDPKWYFLDWSQVPGPPQRLETLVASSLYQACQTWSDAGFDKFEVRYLRTRDGREIDFVVLVNDKPRAAIEVKQSDTRAASTLMRRHEYFGSGTIGLQVVEQPGIARRIETDLWVVSVDRFLQLLH